MYLRTQKAPFHAAPRFPVLMPREPNPYELYYERGAYDGALLNETTETAPRAMGYIAYGTLEAGSAPTQRLVAQYHSEGQTITIHVTAAGEVWWNSQGEEEWQQTCGDGYSDDLPAELAELIYA